MIVHSRAGCSGGPCSQNPTIPCNGPTGTASCGHCDVAGWTLYPATVVRVDGRFGLAYIELNGCSFAFTFDKISGYRGESAKEIGLRDGTTVYAATADGKVLVVSMESPSGEQFPR